MDFESFSSIFSVDGTRQIVTLNQDSLSWVPFTSPSSFPPLPSPNSSISATSEADTPQQQHTVLNLSDVCVLSRSGPRSFSLHCLCVFEKDVNLPRIYVRHEFALVGAYAHYSAPQTTPGEEPCSVGFPTATKKRFLRELRKSQHRGVIKFDFKGWIREVRKALKRVNGDAAERKPVLVIINPFSGTRKASQIFVNECQPLFEAVGLRFHIFETAKAGDAYEKGRSVKVGDYSAIATVGGDGIISEVVNGLMSRNDWHEAISIPISPIAAGSGNATTHSLYNSLSAITATCHIIKGQLRRADIFLAAQPSLSQFIWGVLDCGYGIVAEADFGSERIRWLGSMRIGVWAFYRILCGSLYRARITYLATDQPRSTWHGVRCTRECQLCKTALKRTMKDKDTPDDFIDTSSSASSQNQPTTQKSEPIPITEQSNNSNNQTTATASSSTVSHESPLVNEQEYDGDTEEESEEGKEPIENNDNIEQESLINGTNTLSIGQQQAYGPAFTMSLTHCNNWTDGIPTAYSELFTSYPHHQIGSPLPTGWAQHDNLSISFCTFQKLPWLMPGMLVAPFAHFADGCMDICYATADAFSRVSFMKFFSTFPDGGHVNSPKLSYIKAKSFTIEPLDNDGYIGIDGERVKFAPTQFHVAQGLLNFLCYA